MIALMLPLLLAAPAKIPVGHFACMAGSKRIQVVQSGERLIYTFGPPSRPEITLTGTPAGGVFYYRRMFPRGEHQTLRFVSGRWSYVVFNSWFAPSTLSNGKTDVEYNMSGLLVMKDGQIVRRINCKGGDLVEWPIFKRLPQDEGDLTPEDV